MPPSQVQLASCRPGAGVPPQTLWTSALRGSQVGELSLPQGSRPPSLTLSSDRTTGFSLVLVTAGRQVLGRESGRWTLLLPGPGRFRAWRGSLAVRSQGGRGLVNTPQSPPQAVVCHHGDPKATQSPIPGCAGPDCLSRLGIGTAGEGPARGGAHTGGPHQGRLSQPGVAFCWLGTVGARGSGWARQMCGPCASAYRGVGAGLTSPAAALPLSLVRLADA